MQQFSQTGRKWREFSVRKGKQRLLSVNYSYSLIKIDSKFLFNPIITFVPLPATMLGICTMIHFDVPTHIWLLNLTFICLGTSIALLIVKNSIRLNKISPVIVLIVSTSLLLSTFYDNGIMDVHRWINFYSFRINIGLIVSPLLLIQISRITKPKLAILFSLIISIIFLLQPDASLVSAFSISTYVLLFKKCKSILIKISFLFFTLFMIGYSWYNLDNLEPVSYVENIHNLTKEISMALYFVSLISLLLLIVPFVYDAKNDYLSFSLGINFFVLLLATFFGHFPVMLMGYGISPIIGYYIGLIWKINPNRNLAPKEKITLEKK